MEDYNKVLDATEVAENANGVAAEKMTVYNESLAAAQNRLTASIQQFAQDSNLDQILALAYDGLSKVVEILNILLNKIPILSPMIKALGVALAAAFGAKMLGNAATLVNTITGITTAASGALSILSTTALTIGSFAVPIWGVVAAVTAIGVALKGVYDIVQNNKPEVKLEKANQELEDSNKTLEDTQSKIKDVSDKITEIRDKGTLTLADKQELQELQDQRDVLEQILQYQRDINAEKQKEVKTQTGEQMAGKYTSGTIDSDTAYQWKTQTGGGVASSYAASSGATAKLYNTESASVSELVANLRILDEERKNLMNTEGSDAQQLQENTTQRQENITALKAQAVSIGEDIAKMKELGLTNEDYYKNAVSEYNQIQALVNPANFEKVQLSDLIDTKNLDGKLQEAISAGDEAGQKTAESYARRFADQILHDDTAKNAWAQAMSIDADDLNIDNLSQEISSRLQQMYADVKQSADSALTSNGALKTTAELIDELGQRETDLATKTKSLSDAYNAMTKNGKITSAQMKALIKDYPELASAIEVQNGAIKVNVDLLKDKYNVAIQTEEQVIQGQIKETQIVIENTKKRIEAYQKELAAMTEVLVGNRYVQTTVDSETGLETSESSKSVEAAQTQLDSQIEKLKNAEANLKVLQSELAGLSGQQLTYTGTGSSSSTDKAAKEFENSIKEKIKNLKGVVTTYSTDGFGAWDSQEAIDKATSKYNEFLKEIVDNPEARKIAAEQLGISIEGESTESQIRIVTNALKEQASTIEEAHQKLIKADLEAKDKELAALAEIEKKEKEQYDNALKYIEEIEKTAVSMIETGIDLLDKLGSLIFDKLGEVSDQYDAQLDNLDKISDNLDDQSDALDDQKDAFDDKIDAQKELLKLQKEEMDNADELADKNKAIADIDAQLIELQYDDSAEAQAKRLKLLDERAQKEKDLADYQKEYDYDTKVSALDKEKSAYDKSIESQKKLLELQKKALEEQKKTIEDAQKSYEKTLKGIEDGFNTFIKILSSDVVKNLLSKALISFGGDTAKNLMLGWNKIFGTGDDADIIKQLEDLQKTGWQPGQWLGNLSNWFKGASNTKQSNIDAISQGRSQLSIEKNQLEAGDIDLSKTFTSSVDVKSIKDQLNKVTQVFDNAKSNVSTIMDKLGNGIKTTFGNVGQNIMNFANSLGGNIQVGVQSASDIFTGLGNTLKDVFNLDWTGITGAMGDGLGIVSNTLSKMFTPVANGAASIGDAIGSGITGFFPGIFSAMAQLVSTVGTAMGGVLTTIGDTMAAIPVVGWAIAAAAIAGAVALVATIAGIVSQTKNAKVSQPKQSFTAKKHHNGADYVKKENSALDDMLGLGEDETVSILKVGEAVVPTWANNATSSSNSSSYTGSPFGSAVDSAVKSARANSQTSYRTGDSSVNISMPINIQGDADVTTVRALKKEADNIVNKVLKTINNQTRIGGYRNIKAATV